MAKSDKQEAIDAVVKAIEYFQFCVEAYEHKNIDDLLSGKDSLTEEDIIAYNSYKQTLKGLWNARERVEKY